MRIIKRNDNSYVVEITDYEFDIISNHIKFDNDTDLESVIIKAKANKTIPNLFANALLRSIRGTPYRTDDPHLKGITFNQFKEILKKDNKDIKIDGIGDSGIECLRKFVSLYDNLNSP